MRRTRKQLGTTQADLILNAHIARVEAALKASEEATRKLLEFAERLSPSK